MSRSEELDISAVREIAQDVLTEVGRVIVGKGDRCRCFSLGY